MNIDEIIKVNEKLIYKIASQFYNCDKEDLYQVGVIGLIKAIKNYKNDSNTKFTTYAYDYIFGEMFKLANENRTIKLNKDILKLYKKIETTRYLLAQKLSRFPSNQELALYLEVDESIIETTIMNAQSILSLDEQNNEEGDLYNKVSVKDKVSIEDKIALKDSFKSLNESEKKIIEYRYFKDMTQSETAKELGLTQVMVSRYEKRSLDKMHQYLAS